MEEYINIDLENLPKTDIRKIRGVYFLYRGDKLVYIGSSQDIINRIPTHFKTKEFDSYKYIEINGTIKVAKIETELIRKYKPDYNIAVLYAPKGTEVKSKKDKTKNVKPEKIKTVFAGYKNGKKFYKQIV